MVDVRLTVPILPGLGLTLPVPGDVAARARDWIRVAPGLDSHARWLGKYLRKRLQADVKICGYTLQTTLTLVGQALDHAFQERDRLPHDVYISVLRADLSEPLSIWNVSRDADRQYWSLKREDARIADVLCRSLKTKDSRINLEQRLFPFDPCLKAIIVNNTHALLGFYVLRRRTKGDPAVTAWDYVGTETKLVRIVDRAWGGREILNEVLEWFNRTWLWMDRTAPAPPLSGES